MRRLRSRPPAPLAKSHARGTVTATLLGELVTLLVMLGSEPPCRIRLVMQQHVLHQVQRVTAAAAPKE